MTVAERCRGMDMTEFDLDVGETREHCALKKVSVVLSHGLNSTGGSRGGLRGLQPPLICPKK